MAFEDEDPAVLEVMLRELREHHKKVEYMKYVLANAEYLDKDVIVRALGQAVETLSEAVVQAQMEVEVAKFIQEVNPKEEN